MQSKRRHHRNERITHILAGADKILGQPTQMSTPISSQCEFAEAPLVISSAPPSGSPGLRYERSTRSRR
jgi:hypothetical protein